MIIPSGEKLIVKVIVQEEVSPGGIVIPKETRDKEDLAQVRAEVIAIGPLAFEAEAEHERKYGRDISDSIPKVGEKIMMAKYAGHVFKEDGEFYRIIKDEDVTAILRGEENG